jgi:hypothetical protein
MVFLESEARPVGVIWTLNLDEPTPMITPLLHRLGWRGPRRLWMGKL